MNNFKKIDFGKAVSVMKEHNMPIPVKSINVKMDNARDILKQAFEYYLGLQGKEMVWLDAYNHVADWLTDNKGKGLMMYGAIGQGKSLLSRYILPSILLYTKRLVLKSYDVQEMNTNIDLIRKRRLVSLDDIGTEATQNSFGNKREAFAEIIDSAEKTGQIVVFSTNLDKSGIINRYGDRVLDRITATTKRVLFTGKSLRI